MWIPRKWYPNLPLLAMRSQWRFPTIQWLWIIQLVVGYWALILLCLEALSPNNSPTTPTNRVQSSIPLDSMTMTDFDYYYGNFTLLIKNSTKDTQMGHFANEKLLFSELIQYDSLPPTQQCSSNTGSSGGILLWVGILEYFSKNMKTLLIPCGPDRLLSHCQLYSLFTINMRTKQCAPYHRQQCTLSF